MNAVMMVSALSSVFAVLLLALSGVFGGGSNSGVASNAGLFKSGNPSLDGHASTQSLEPPAVVPGVTLEHGRHVHEPRVD